MTTAALALAGIAGIVLWAGITGENLMEAIGAVLKGETYVRKNPYSPPASPTVGTPTSSAGGTNGGTGGNWASSKATVEALTAPAKAIGLTATNKRTTQKTKTGGDSDHWTGSLNAYAEDLSGSVALMDRAAIAIMQQLGYSYNGTSSLVYTTYRNGYRIQVLYRTNVGGNHFNHIHVGAKKT